MAARRPKLMLTAMRMRNWVWKPRSSSSGKRPEMVMTEVNSTGRNLDRPDAMTALSKETPLLTARLIKSIKMGESFKVFESSQAPWGTLFRNRQGKVNGRGIPQARAGGGVDSVVSQSCGPGVKYSNLPARLRSQGAFQSRNPFDFGKEFPMAPPITMSYFQKAKVLQMNEFLTTMPERASIPKILIYGKR